MNKSIKKISDWSASCLFWMIIFFFLSKTLSKFHSCVSYTCIYITCAHVATFILLINVSIKINNVSEETIREAVFHGFVVSAVSACESLNHSYGNILDFPKEHHINYRWEQGSFINKCSSVYSWVFNVKLKSTNILFIGKCFETSFLTTYWYNYQNQPKFK